MLHKRLVSACLKRGATITETRKGSFSATVGENLLTWHIQDDRAICVCTPSPHTDVMTDCFCDTFHHTIKAAADSLGPVAPKKSKKQKAPKVKVKKNSNLPSVKELVKAADLKPGFVVSDPVSGGEYAIGTRGRPPVWLAERLAEMVDPSKLEAIAPKPVKAPPAASKAVSAAANAEGFIVVGPLRSTPRMVSGSLRWSIRKLR
jgi:hypothetical protein